MVNSLFSCSEDGRTDASLVFLHYKKITKQLMYIRSSCIIDIQVYHGSKLIPPLFNSGRFLLIDEKLGFMPFTSFGHQAAINKEPKEMQRWAQNTAFYFKWSWHEWGDISMTFTVTWHNASKRPLCMTFTVRLERIWNNVGLVSLRACLICLVKPSSGIIQIKRRGKRLLCLPAAAASSCKLQVRRTWWCCHCRFALLVRPY